MYDEPSITGGWFSRGESLVRNLQKHRRKRQHSTRVCAAKDERTLTAAICTDCCSGKLQIKPLCTGIERIYL